MTVSVVCVKCGPGIIPGHRMSLMTETGEGVTTYCWTCICGRVNKGIVPEKLVAPLARMVGNVYCYKADWVRPTGPPICEMEVGLFTAQLHARDYLAGHAEAESV
jgi:hypothetical protein